MSGGRPNDDSTARRADWRGRSRSRRSVKHRWQKRTAQQRGVTRPLRTMLRSVVSLAVLLAMSLGFVYLMRFRPRQTPVVAMVATQYRGPFQPNGWAFEDLQALRGLDADTLILFDATEDFSTRAQFLAELDRLTRSAVRAVRDSEPIVVYLSVHVDTDAEGRPAFLPVGASPLDPATWVPFEEVVEQIVSSREEERRSILLVVDCHRYVANWHRAEATNTFVDAVQSSLLSHPVKNLTVMTSCGTGEQSLIFKSRRQSSFGHYFVEGLRGNADLTPIGNGDHYVSIQELMAYVSQNVAGYARSVFGVRQTVQLMGLESTEGKDFTVSWVSTETPERAIEQSAGGPAADLDQLWASYESLSADQPQTTLPTEWANVQYRLMRLEKLVESGAACQAEAAMESNQLRLTMNRLTDQLALITREDPATEACQESVSAGTATTAAALGTAVRAIHEKYGQHQSPTLHFASLLSQQRGNACWAFSGLVREAIATRGLAESTWTAIPAGRLPWCAAQLNLADESRRKAEDALLTGQNARDGFRVASAAYQLAADRSASTELAVDALATALSELAWWTRWKAASADSTPDALLELMESTHRLAAGLSDSRLQLASLAVLPFTSPTRQVQQLLKQHRNELNEEYRRLLRDMSTSTKDIHRAMALLEMPLLPAPDPATGTTGAAQRQELRHKLDDAIAARVNNRSLSDGDMPLENIGRSAQEEMLVQHLLAVQNRSAERDSDTGRLNAQAGTLRFRSSLQEVYDSCETALTANQPELSDYRQQLINSEFRLRLIAPLYVPEGVVNTIAARQRLDRRVKTLDLCQRTLDDFYGPAVPADEPYFFTTVTRLLTSFRGQQDESIALQRQLVDMNRLLDRRRRLLTEGLSLKTSSVLLLGSTQLDAVDVHVHSDGPLERYAMSPLVGSLYFADDENTVLSNTDQLPLIPDGGPSETNFSGRLTLTEKGIRQSSTQVFAVANLRGNIIREPVLVGRSGGAEVSTLIPAVRTATVDVSGRAASGQSIAVIFDCSQSMSSPVASEVLGNEQTRFDVGLRALSHLLNELSVEKNSRVGLMLFGHRVGWNPRSPQQMLINDAYTRNVPGDLRPYDDVEMVLPIGRFDAATRQAASPLLASLRPWGETPLYLALTDAFTALEKEDVRRARRVIVLTDGVNRQTNPTAARKRTLDDVLKAMPGQVQVDIVGYQISPRESGKAEADFQAIADASGGRFQSTNDLTGLLESLSGLLETDEFRLRRADGKTLTSSPGQSISLTIDGDSENVFLDMGEAQATFELQGGESLQWQLSKDAQRLEIPPWKVGAPRWVNLSEHETGNDSDLACAIQSVRRKNQVAHLEFSVQDRRHRFTPRPESFQVYLTPLDESGKRVGETYVCDTSAFLPGTPVPAVGVDAHNWPVNASQAEVSVFVQRTSTEPLDRLSLSRLTSMQDAVPFERSISGINDVVVFVIADRQQSRLTVVEQHGATSPGVDSLQVRLSTAGTTAYTRRQRADRKNHVVSTVFEFDASEGIPLANGTLEFILRSEGQKNSLHTPIPVTIPVSSDNGLLIPTD